MADLLLCIIFLPITISLIPTTVQDAEDLEGDMRRLQWLSLGLCLFLVLTSTAYAGGETGGDDGSDHGADHNTSEHEDHGHEAGHEDGAAATSLDEESEDHHASGGTATAILIAGVLGGAIVAGLSWFLMRQHFALLQYAIIFFGVATGIIHTILGFRGDTLLLLNGLGYLSLIAALHVPLSLLQGWQQPLRWVLLAYTAVTLAGYLWLHTVAEYTVLGLTTKGIEIALIAFLALRLAGLGEAKTTDDRGVVTSQ